MATWTRRNGRYRKIKEGQFVKVPKGERLDMRVIGGIEGAVPQGKGLAGDAIGEMEVGSAVLPVVLE
ncbi:hypothetical protein L6452_05134 [Arctium lappa]|uniref:Uncharacterized protein n=1 Tax=Arctium lappa TaxID=4217 RepID=A0ACB9EG70_ARCLA|nr:hypothetical protein L6452_05134 [Arctium lappa]